ncbi:hypothetical protein K0M31_005155 [Melipona bicolor]|uniref:Uncharacterized protein n=1 Tax=Melipona bicolor TaxID=60889 RepID=A0AA40FUE4_9HYME|nr:hypothetical protein K0M31_005155 [Melipona bicolor]
MTRVAVSEYVGEVIVTGRYKTTKWGVTAVTATVEVRRTRERMARDLVIAQQLKSRRFENDEDASFLAHKIRRHQSFVTQLLRKWIVNSVDLEYRDAICLIRRENYNTTKCNAKLNVIGSVKMTQNCDKLQAYKFIKSTNNPKRGVVCFKGNSCGIIATAKKSDRILIAIHNTSRLTRGSSRIIRIFGSCRRDSTIASPEFIIQAGLGFKEGKRNDRIKSDAPIRTHTPRASDVNAVQDHSWCRSNVSLLFSKDYPT